MMSLIKYLYQKLRNNAFYKSVVLVAGGTAVAQAISVLLAPIYSRIYSPESYGVLAVFNAILGFLAPIATLTYATTIPLPDDEDLADNLLKLCLIITGIIGLFLSVLVFFKPDILVNTLSLQRAEPYLWFLPFCFIGAGWHTALSNWAIRKKNFKLIAKTKIVQILSSSIIKLGLGLSGFQVLGLLISLLINTIAGNVSLLWKYLKESSTFFTFSLDGIKNAALRYYHFPLYRTWSRIILSGANRLPILFIAASFDAKIVGYYAFAKSIICMPMNLIGTSVAQVYYAEIASFGKGRPDKIYKLSISIIKKLILISIIPFIILVLGGPFIFGTVFGKEWYTAGVFARYLAIMVIAQLISVPLMNCLNVFEKQKTQFCLNILHITGVIIVFLSCRSFDASAITTILSFSVFILLYAIIMIFIALTTVRNAIASL